MKLIDANALKDRIDKCMALSGIGLEPVMAVRDIKALILAMPTIDAIPVKWLKEQADYARFEWDYDTCEGIRIVLKAWEKEQEV